MSVEAIKAEITKLSHHQKVEMMHFLVDEVAGGEEEFELTEEMKAELDRREAAIKNGTARLFTWEEVKSSIQQRKSPQ
jgi:putative addiction module component (TIGR02574 family)